MLEAPKVPSSSPVRRLRGVVSVRVSRDGSLGRPAGAGSTLPAYDAPTSLTLLTDASRADVDDGVGGFAFLPSMAGTVFMFSVPWPADIKAALDRGAASRADRRRRFPLALPRFHSQRSRCSAPSHSPQR
ncbi:hypothetical protein AB1Y20_009452 [Prymnesium parvum]|uniref:Uncharacterized protein n=1 Tax=Prymnesium parvum TaxID=97485 RepID=A0AB34K4T1_PRYPA